MWGLRRAPKWLRKIDLFFIFILKRKSKRDENEDDDGDDLKTKRIKIR